MTTLHREWVYCSFIGLLRVCYRLLSCNLSVLMRVFSEEFIISIQMMGHSLYHCHLYCQILVEMAAWTEPHVQLQECLWNLKGGGKNVSVMVFPSCIFSHLFFPSSSIQTLCNADVWTVLIRALSFCTLIAVSLSGHLHGRSRVCRAAWLLSVFVLAIWQYFHTCSRQRQQEW